MESSPQLSTRSFKLDKKQFQVHVEHKYELCHVLALQDYNILLYFESGEVMLVNGFDSSIKRKTVIDSKMKQPFVYDHEFVCYINPSTCKLEFFNYQTMKVMPPDYSQIALPTLRCLPQQKRTPEQIQIYFSDGIRICFLSQSKLIVSFEVNFDTNTYILSAFDQNYYNALNTQETKALVCQAIIEEEKDQKRPFISKLNNMDLVAIWGPNYQHQPFDLLIWKIRPCNGGQLQQNQQQHSQVKSISLQSQGSMPQLNGKQQQKQQPLSTECNLIWKVRLDQKIDGEILGVFPFETDKISVWGNYNDIDFPFLKVFQCGACQEDGQILSKYKKNQDGYRQNCLEKTVSLDLFESEKQGDWLWSIKDILLFNHENKIIIWERNDNLGNHIDIYDLDNQCVAYSEKINDSDEEGGTFVFMELCKVASVDGKYMVGYDPNIYEFNVDNKRVIPFQISKVMIDKQGQQQLF